MPGLSTWTEEEYARVASALLYPVVARAKFTAEYFAAADVIPRNLFFALQDLPETRKLEVLTLADEVRRSEQALFSAAEKAPHVTKVGNINLDTAQGQRIRAQAVEQRRDRLANAIPFDVNPSATRLDSGGVNATWSP